MNVNVFSGIHAGLELLKSVESAGEGEKFLRQEKYRNRLVRLLITNFFQISISEWSHSSSRYKRGSQVRG